MSDFLRTLRQFRRFRSAPNSQTLFLKNPTALGAPAYPLSAPFACSPSAFLSEKDLQAVRSTLPSRRRLQTLAHLQIPLRHGKPSHLSPSERLFYSAFLFGWRFANKTRLIFPFHRHKSPRANCNAPARSAPFLFSLHFSLFTFPSKSRPEGRLSVFSKCFAALFGLLCLFLRLVVEDVFKILFATEVLVFTARRTGVSESVRDLLCARRYSFRNL